MSDSTPHGIRRVRCARPAVAAVLTAFVAVACVPASGGTRGTSSLRASRPTAPPMWTTTSAARTDTTVKHTTTTTPKLTPSTGHVAADARMGVAGCPLFPEDNVFHASVRGLPVRSGSAETITAGGGSSLKLMAGVSNVMWEGSLPGIPINVVDSRTAEKKDLLVNLDYASGSEHLGVPWPDEPRFEGWPGRAWDKHLLIVDSHTCKTWELINVQPPWENLWGALTGRWYADSVAVWDLRSNTPRTGVAVTASVVSLMSTPIRYEEVASGDVEHVLGVSLPKIRSNGFEWPARATDGRSTDPHAPRMGTWLRLRAGADLSKLGPQARVIAQALKDHGAIVLDSGANFAIGGATDVRWNSTDLAGLGKLTLADFEVVDPSAMKVSSGSFQIRP